MSFPLPGDLPHQGMEPKSLTSPALADRFFTISATWKALQTYKMREIIMIKIKDNDICKCLIHKNHSINTVITISCNSCYNNINIKITLPLGMCFISVDYD